MNVPTSKCTLINYTTYNPLISWIQSRPRARFELEMQRAQAKLYLRSNSVAILGLSLGLLLLLLAPGRTTLLGFGIGLGMMLSSSSYMWSSSTSLRRCNPSSAMGFTALHLIPFFSNCPCPYRCAMGINDYKVGARENGAADESSTHFSLY